MNWVKIVVVALQTLPDIIHAIKDGRKDKKEKEKEVEVRDEQKTTRLESESDSDDAFVGE